MHYIALHISPANKCPFIQLPPSPLTLCPLAAIGLGKNRWITAEQHQEILTLKRIAGTGIAPDCFSLTGSTLTSSPPHLLTSSSPHLLTGSTTRLGFCTEDDRRRAQALQSSRTLTISSTGLERSRFKALGVQGLHCTPDDVVRARDMIRRTGTGVPWSCFGKEVDPVWCSAEQLKVAKLEWDQNCDWLPSGTNHPKDEKILVSKRPSRPYSGKKVEVSITPTLGGTLLSASDEDSAA